MKEMNKADVKRRVLSGIVNTVILIAAVLAARFLKAHFSHTPFDPEWVRTIIEAVIVGCVIAWIAPDAEQRKKNRENLANKFKRTKKN